MNMNRFLLLIISLIVSTCISAYSPSDVRAYIAKYKDIALEQERIYKIPATITLAQGILESGAGKSRLAVEGNNHFGIKAYGDWKGPTIQAIDDHPYPSSFKKYNSARESFEDHSKVLCKDEYQKKLDYYHVKSVKNYRGWAKAIKEAGYATGKNYDKKLIAIIDNYQLYKINGGEYRAPKIISGSTPQKQRNQTSQRNQRVQRTQTVPQTNAVVAAPEDEEMGEDEEVDYVTEEEYNEEKRLEEIFSKYEDYINDIRCTILYPGQTIADIAYEYGIPEKKLLEYNETSSVSDFEYGDYVYLKKKSTKYNGHKSYESYYWAKEGDNLYKVSQLHGIKLSSLKKLNEGIPYNLSVGTKIRLK